MSKILILILFSINANASTFTEALKYIDKHPKVGSLLDKAKALRSQGKIKGAWIDPKLMVMAKNYPKNLDPKTNPMTGIDFSINQKISLTNRVGNIKNSYYHKSNSIKNQALDQKQLLIKLLWKTLIEKKQIDEEIKIFEENLIWITKMLEVSNKLYANGTISSQAILDIQIRKSEIETLIANKKIDKLNIKNQLQYISGFESIDETTIPWDELDNTKKKTDFRNKSYLELRKSNELLLRASRKNWLPDLNLSFVYTKKFDEDLIGMSVAMPLPFTVPQQSYKALMEKSSIEKTHQDYKNQKKSDIVQTTNELSKIEKELAILNEKTIKFAMDLRNITAKSYSLGNSTYTELLQSELKLQNILLKKIMLEAESKIKKVKLNYLGA